MEQAENNMTDQEAGEESTAKTAVAFVVALVVFGALFLLLDYAVMSAQGLTLMYHG